MSQQSQILKRLKMGPATTLDFVLMGVLRGSERVRELEAKGYVIRHQMVKRLNRFNKPCYVARYTLIKEIA